MLNLQRFIIVMFLSILFSMGAAAQILTSGQLTNESTDSLEVRTYAKNFGISVKEAKHRFQLIDKIGNLEQRLNRDNPATFAGLWLEHSPKFRIVASFAGKPKKKMGAYISDS